MSATAAMSANARAMTTRAMAPVGPTQPADVVTMLQTYIGVRLTRGGASGEVCAMPSRFQVQGGRPLNGSVRPAGNKNAALPILAATLLADGPVALGNVPRIRDVEAMVALLGDLGAHATWTGANAVTVDGRRAVSKPLDPELCSKIRASILFAAPLLARFGKVVL